MKIAFLILCHKNPLQINMMIEKLRGLNADFFIHIDNKSTIEEQLLKGHDIHVLPENESFDVAWGSCVMIRATLNLIRATKKSAKYDYLWLISGQDFLIQSTDKVEAILSKDISINYIEILPKGHKRYNRYKKWYEMWYPKWISSNHFCIKVIKRLYMLFTGGREYTFRVFRRNKPFNEEFQFGSQWWTLTSECAYALLDYSDSHPEIINYFEHTIVPDECFFQTLFSLLQYGDTVHHNLTFVNWGENTRSPEVFRIEDYEILQQKSKDYCLARKFDCSIDCEIINCYL